MIFPLDRPFQQRESDHKPRLLLIRPPRIEGNMVLRLLRLPSHNHFSNPQFHRPSSKPKRSTSLSPAPCNAVGAKQSLESTLVILDQKYLPAGSKYKVAMTKCNIQHTTGGRQAGQPRMSGNYGKKAVCCKMNSQQAVWVRNAQYKPLLFSTTQNHT